MRVSRSPVVYENDWGSTHSASGTTEGTLEHQSAKKRPFVPKKCSPFWNTFCCRGHANCDRSCSLCPTESTHQPLAAGLPHFFLSFLPQVGTHNSLGHTRVLRFVSPYPQRSTPSVSVRVLLTFEWQRRQVWNTKASANFRRLVWHSVSFLKVNFL